MSAYIIPPFSNTLLPLQVELQIDHFRKALARSGWPPKHWQKTYPSFIWSRGL